ncbi:hypothetical protein BGZ70_005636 [Mortierella alpina]|uniref:Uncharacterized protein n=1 Tax=Mortierella alpina TaxID=64518 RepID=A0A9P6JE43_MORAP|nr:hypothetical protein BGZ70_005636 [Mortierella alpina]
MGAAWADKLLDRSWNTALVNDPELIHDLQAEGFDDRSAGSPEACPGSEDLPSCGEILKLNFGSRLEKLGTMLLLLRLLQLSGVLLLAILFKYLALIDREESEQEDKNTLVTITEKSGYDLAEKQSEDKHVHVWVPLLLEDDIDGSGPPPDYCESVKVHICADLLEPDREARGCTKK